MSDAASRFAARYGETLDGLAPSLDADDDVLGFDPADYAETLLLPLPDPAHRNGARLDRDQRRWSRGCCMRRGCGRRAGTIRRRCRPAVASVPAATGNCGGASARRREVDTAAACLPPSGLDPVRLIDTRERGR